MMFILDDSVLELIKTQTELLIRLLVSVALGALIGFQREKKHKPAGLRTHIFVCMGSCLFTIASFTLFPDDPARIASGIVAGISFIGAGSIIAGKGDIRGITTAASLWVVAAIGLMIGLGEYIIPISATIIAFLVLNLGDKEKALI